MEQPSSRLAYLFDRYTAGTCTDQERDEYLELVNMETYAVELQELIGQAIAQAGNEKSLSPDERDKMLHAILRGTETPVVPMEPIRKHPLTWWAAAAVLVLLVSGTWILLTRSDKAKQAETLAAKVVKHGISPGGNKAMLTLGNGSTMVLDSAVNGVLAQQGNAKVLKTNNGRLAYNITSEKPAEVLYNTLATPRGGQYQLVLPDGTQVWLNSASSITYPTAFTGNQRNVKITGEVYFEVANKPQAPFKVVINDHTEVEVLGTHFNINAYLDENAINTTLLEGAVKITGGSEMVLLHPGQQAQIQPLERIKIVKDADIDKVMAWKNGLFNFEGLGMEEVMKQLSRWYDIDVVYEKGVPDIKFVGEVSKNVALPDLLNGLSGIGVHFKIEQGRRLIIQP
jgi:hypothetical protein